MDIRWQEILSGRRRAEVDDIQKWADREQAKERHEIEAAAAVRIEAASGLVPRALRLLVDADQAWTTVTGTVRSSGDEQVLDIGRELYHDEHDASDLEGEESKDSDDSEEELGPWSVDAHFVAAQPPFRLRLEYLRDTTGSGEGSERDLLIVTARRYVVLSHGRVKTVRASPRRILSIPGAGEVWSAYEDGVERGKGGNTTYGVENLDTLLRPAGLIRAFVFVSATETIEAGRDAIELSAVPVPSDDFYIFGRDLVALGPTAYTITIDASYGIILAWSVSVNGMHGKGQTLRDVVIDHPLDEGAFTATR